MKLWLTLFVIAIIIISILLSINFSSGDVTASELSQAYEFNTAFAEEEYTGQEITIIGKVKAFYRLLGTREVLELETYSNTPVICFFHNEDAAFSARQFKLEDEVRVEGTCAGTRAYSFVSGVKIDVDDIELQ